MPLPQQQDEGLASATTKAISALLDAHACSICHDLLSAPVALPCTHVFCSECVRRHLSTKSLCPHPTCRRPTTCMQLTPLRGYDVSLEPLRRTGLTVEPAKLSGQKRLVFLSRKGSSRAQLMERLRTHDVPTHGGIDAIANRYNEFVIRWNANLDAGVPKSKKSIVAAVLTAEREAAKESRRRRRTSSFFMKAASAESKGDLEVPAEGDDFAMLVKKTKARLERKRKLAMVAQENEKRVCLTPMGGDCKTKVGSQGKLGNDCDDGIGQVSQPPGDHALRQPDRIQNPVDMSKDENTSLDRDACNPMKDAHVSSQCLSVNHSVCGLNIASDEVKKNNGSGLLGPSVEAIQPTGHGIARMLPQGPTWSQTTPEKQTVPVPEEREGGTSDRQNDVTISVKQQSCGDPFVQTSRIPLNPHSNPKPNSANPPSHASAVFFRRPRPLSVDGSPVPPGRNLNSPYEPSPQTHNMSNTPKESRHSSQLSPSHGPGDVGDLPSKGFTPTKEQLERAERNRLAALAKRKRFYERRQGLSQMRQPEL